MKGRIQTLKQNKGTQQGVSFPKQQESSANDFIKINRFSEILTSEGNDGFRNYIEWLGLSHDPKLVVLSSVHHYFYDAEEMKHINTVINLKKLNHIKEINDFLHSMFLILPSKCFFIGCFIDNKKQSGLSFRKNTSPIPSNLIEEDEDNGIGSRVPFLNTIFNILDAKPNRYLSGKNVAVLLKNNRFKVLDMTELDSVTYFCAQTEHNEVN